MILMKDIRAWIKDARPYLKKHQDRPDIAKALGWIERLVYQGGSAPLPDVHDNSAPDTRLLRWLVFLRKREVSPIDALALVVAMFAYRAFSPREFRSDRQFVHSLVIRFIRQAGSTKRPGNRGRRQKHYERITVGVRELLGPSLITNLGAVSHAIAKELVGRFDEANPARHLQALL